MFTYIQQNLYIWLLFRGRYDNLACSGTAGMGAEVFKDRAILRMFTLPKVNSKVCLLKQIIVIMEKLRALFTRTVKWQLLLSARRLLWQ